MDKGKNQKKSLAFNNPWVKVLIITVVSLLVAVVGIGKNIEREKQKVFSDMRSKIKCEVEKELYSELMDKFKEGVRSDLKKEYRDFVKLELKNSLREDTFRSLKHQIDNESSDLLYEVFETMEYKENGENIIHCEVIVKDLDKVFEEELEGLFKQIFSKREDKKGVLLVFDKEPEESGYMPKFRLEQGLNGQILVIRDGDKSKILEDSIIY